MPFVNGFFQSPASWPGNQKTYRSGKHITEHQRKHHNGGLSRNDDQQHHSQHKKTKRLALDQFRIFKGIIFDT